MQVKIIKESSIYKKGIIDVTDGRGKYLIAVGVATAITEPVKETSKSKKQKKSK